MGLSTLFAIIFLICACIHVVGECIPEPRKIQIRHATKPLLMPLLIVYYLTAAAELALPLNALIITGVALGFVGDVTLMWPKNQKCFIVGLLCFLLGHVLYIVAFLGAMNYFATVPWWFYLSLLAYGAFFFVAFRFLGPSLKEMKVPVIVYMSLLLGMSFIALAVALSSAIGDVRNPWWLVLGSVNFIISDFLLANQNFRTPFKNDQAIIMATYIIAQFLIVQGYLF